MNENNNRLCTTTLGDKENTAAHARSAAAGASHNKLESSDSERRETEVHRIIKLLNAKQTMNFL